MKKPTSATNLSIILRLLHSSVFVFCAQLAPHCIYFRVITTRYQRYVTQSTNPSTNNTHPHSSAESKLIERDFFSLEWNPHPSLFDLLRGKSTFSLNKPCCPASVSDLLRYSFSYFLLFDLCVNKFIPSLQFYILSEIYELKSSLKLNRKSGSLPFFQSYWQSDSIW